MKLRWPFFFVTVLLVLSAAAFYYFNPPTNESLPCPIKAGTLETCELTCHGDKPADSVNYGGVYYCCPIDSIGWDPVAKRCKTKPK